VGWGGGSAGARRPELVDLCRPWRSGSGGGDGPGGPQAASTGTLGRAATEEEEAARRFGHRGDPRGELGDRRRGPGGRGAAAATEQEPYPSGLFFSRAPSAPRELDGRDKKRKENPRLFLARTRGVGAIFIRERGRDAGTRDGSSNSSGGAHPRATPPPPLRPPRRRSAIR
jgi:hypothetical protein